MYHCEIREAPVRDCRQVQKPIIKEINKQSIKIGDKNSEMHENLASKFDCELRKVNVV